MYKRNLRQRNALVHATSLLQDKILQKGTIKALFQAAKIY